MNVYEAGVVRRILEGAGYGETGDEREADVLLMMTCSVRSHAEARALGRIGAFRALRGGRPGCVIGVLGCMAQRFGDDLVRNERVDLVVGPDCYLRLPELLHDIACGSKGLVVTDQSLECYDDVHPLPGDHRTQSETDERSRPASVTAFVTIMRGCDNYCSYCIVPYVKGRERSKSYDRVLDEVRALIDSGVKDVTLLGQNVSAYRDGERDFVALLEAVDRVAGDARVRFLTSHPRDLNERVLGAMRDLGSVCPALHLPLQSGSDRILRLMNRGYTSADYVRKVTRARELVPDLSLSTDVIVGFPSETDVEFGETLTVIQDVRFDSAYMFRYSQRPGTAATGIAPRVGEADSGRRLARLIEVQNRITAEQSRQMVGRECELLVEGPSPRERAWLGRTRNNKIVIVNGALAPGDFVRCRVTRVNGWTPIAEIGAPVAAAC